MVVSVETVAKRYEAVAAGLPISVTIPAYETSDIYVYYGAASILAEQVVDYTVELGGDFETFTITPTASLIAKINALIALDATEENYITVRRTLDYLTDATPDGVRYTPFTSREFDRNAMRDAQLAEKLSRALVLSPNFVGDEPLLELQSVEPGRALIVNDDGTAIIPGPNAADIASAQENAAIATAAAAAASLYGNPFFIGTLVDFAADVTPARGDGVFWRFSGPWGTCVFIETSASPDFTNAAGVGLDYVEDRMDVRVWGLTGVGDETSEIEAMAQWAAVNAVGLDWPEDIMYSYDELRIDGDHDWVGAWLHSTKAITDYVPAIKFRRNDVTSVNVTADFDMGDNSIVVDDASLIQVGDFMRVEATRLIPAGHRGQWTEGQLMRVQSIAGNVVTFDTSFVFSYINSVQTGTVTAISGDRLTLTISNPTSNTDARFVRKRMRITSGAAAGAERYIISAAGSTVTHKASWDNSAWPVTLLVGDAYSFESVCTASVYRPNTVKLRNARFTRDRVFTATDGDEAVSGLDVDGCYFTMTDSVIDGFPETGIQIQRCYDALIQDCEIKYANRAYGEGAGHGYGINVAVCHAPKIINVEGYSNRRTVDFSGSRGYTTYGLAQNVTNRGGGFTYGGDRFFPQGAVQCSIAGSHGAGYACRYINCHGQDVFTGHMLRGQREVVQNLVMNGYGYYGARMTEGGNGATIRGIRYDDQFTMIGVGNYVRGTQDDKRMMYAVEIQDDDEFVFAEPVHVSGIRAHAIIGATVFVTTKVGGTSLVRNLTITDTKVTCAPDSLDAVTDFRVLGFDEDVEIDDCVLKDNTFRALDTYAGSAMVLAMAPDPFAAAKPFATLPLSGKMWIDGKVWVSIEDQTVVRVPVEAAQAVVLLNITNAEVGTGRPRAFGLGLADRDANDHNAGASFLSNIEILAASPGSAAAATAGNIGVNLDRSDGRLSLANNRGSDHVLVIDGL